MNLINKHDSSYIGYDINNQMIKEIKKKYKDVKFECLDVVHDMLPKTDIIICRDCLFHLTTEDGITALKNFKNSGSTFLLTTTFDNIKENFNLKRTDLIKRYGFRRINVQIEPYNLKTPIAKCYEKELDRYFCLWKIN